MLLHFFLCFKLSGLCEEAPVSSSGNDSMQPDTRYNICRGACVPHTSHRTGRMPNWGSTVSSNLRRPGQRLPVTVRIRRRSSTAFAKDSTLFFA